VGGIEAFATDLLLSFSHRNVPVSLICWNAAGKDRIPALTTLLEGDVRVYSSSWKWGCRWGWPDKIMAHKSWDRILDSDVLVFGKMLHDSVHRRLLGHKKRMVLITPYRPAEMWKVRRPDDEVLNSFQTIIVQAVPFEEDLRKFGYKGKTVILPYVPPDARETAPWPAGPPLRIGFLGRLVPDKNLPYLLGSLGRLRENGVQAEMHIFGDGPEGNALHGTAGRARLAEYVKFHGSQRRDQIPRAIDSCHMFAFSSTTEGQCLAALEILARGRPIVATPVGAFPQILNDTRLGCIAPLNDVDLFAAALNAVAQPVMESRITPADIQNVYMEHFPRGEVIDEYSRVFGCPAYDPEKATT
jgi:glycosyltransferase involved in cell wall biosynthesis